MRSVLIAALALAAVLPVAAQRQTTPAPTEAAPAHKTFVLKGCLVAGTAASPAFKLVDASTVGQAPPPQSVNNLNQAEPTPVGTSGARSSYDLVATSGLEQKGLTQQELSSNVGQRVQVTVRLLDQVAPPAPPAGAPVAVRDEPLPQRFSVTELAHSEGSCKLRRQRQWTVSLASQS